MIKENGRRAEELAGRILNHPELGEQFATILDLAENRDGRAETADEAEELAVKAVRRLGKEVIQEWCAQRGRELNAPYERRTDAEKDGKKNSIGTPAWERLR